MSAPQAILKVCFTDDPTKHNKLWDIPVLLDIPKYERVYEALFGVPPEVYIIPVPDYTMPILADIMQFIYSNVPSADNPFATFMRGQYAVLESIGDILDILVGGNVLGLCIHRSYIYGEEHPVYPAGVVLSPWYAEKHGAMSPITQTFVRREYFHTPERFMQTEQACLVTALLFYGSHQFDGAPSLGVTNVYTQPIEGFDVKNPPCLIQPGNVADKPLKYTAEDLFMVHQLSAFDLLSSDQVDAITDPLDLTVESMSRINFYEQEPEYFLFMAVNVGAAVSFTKLSVETSGTIARNALIRESRDPEIHRVFFRSHDKIVASLAYKVRDRRVIDILDLYVEKGKDREAIEDAMIQLMLHEFTAIQRAIPIVWMRTPNTDYGRHQAEILLRNRFYPAASAGSFAPNESQYKTLLNLMA